MFRRLQRLGLSYYRGLQPALCQDFRTNVEVLQWDPVNYGIGRRHKTSIIILNVVFLFHSFMGHIETICNLIN